MRTERTNEPTVTGNGQGVAKLRIIVQGREFRLMLVGDVAGIPRPVEFLLSGSFLLCSLRLCLVLAVASRHVSALP